MAKKIVTITEDWVDSIKKLKIGEKARILDKNYNTIMNSTRYQLERKEHSVFFKTIDEKYFIGDDKYFNIIRVLERKKKRTS